MPIMNCSSYRFCIALLNERQEGVVELRTLEYFLAVAREGNISNAAKALHITQPTLSRQLSSLEKEFGRELYTRGPKGIELTDQGSILCRYAESIVELARKAEEDMLPSERSIGGTVHIGAGESQAMTLIAQAMDEVRRTYPAVDFAIHSGTTAELKDGLVRGFYDVMLECEMREHAKMNTMHLPVTDVWGAVALRDSAVGWTWYTSWEASNFPEQIRINAIRSLWFLFIFA